MTFKEARRLRQGHNIQHDGKVYKFLRLEKVEDIWFVVVLEKRMIPKAQGQGFVMQGGRHSFKAPSIRLPLESCSSEVLQRPRFSGDEVRVKIRGER